VALTLNRPWQSAQKNKSTGNVTNASGTVPDVQRDEVSQRTKTPRALWRPPTPYTRFVRQGYCDTTELSASLESPTSIVTRSGGCSYSGFYASNPPAFPQYLVDRTISKCLDKLKNDDVNLGVAFAERDQVDRLIGSNATRIAEDIEHGWADRLKTLERDLRNARSPKAIKRLLDLIAEVRLEIAYGWVPLMQDSFGAVKHLSEREKEANRATITVTSKARESYTDLYSTGAAVGSFTVNVDRFREIEFICKTRLDYYKDNGLVHELSQLGITNPALIIWERTPWSFVADWFLPIGDYLNRLDASLGMTFRGGSTSKKCTVKVRPQNGRCVNTGVTGSVTPSGKGYMMLFNRVTYSASPMVPPPHFNTGRSLSHVYNGAALISLALRKFGF